MVYKVIDYKGEARGRVTEQFEDAVVFKRYLELLMSGSMEMQEVLKQLKELRWIDTATGSMLDIIGKIVGQERFVNEATLDKYFTFLGVPFGKGYSDTLDRTSGGEYRDALEREEGVSIELTDSEYRTFILTKIFKNNTNCTPNEFIEFFSFVLDAAEVRIEELGNARVKALVIGSFTEFQETILFFYKQSLGFDIAFFPKPVGVGVEIEVLNYRDTESETVGFTNFSFIDTHILKDIDDSLGFYAAVKGGTQYWYGCTLSFSRDGGRTYFKSVDIDESAVIGSLTQDMGEHPHWYMDEDSEVHLKLFGDINGEIKGNTHVDVLNRKGMILVGDELMNYEDVVQVGDPEDYTWKLSRLLRGRKNGTSREHLVGERVVFLDYGTVPFIKDVKLEKGESYTVKVHSKKTQTQFYLQSVSYDALSQTETAPAKLNVRRDGDELHISWFGVGKMGRATRSDTGRYFDGYRVYVGTRSYDTEEQKIVVPFNNGLVRVVQMNKLTGEGISAEVMV